MAVTLLIAIVLASLLIIASGFWVGLALVRWLSVPRRPGTAAQARRKEGQAP